MITYHKYLNIRLMMGIALILLQGSCYAGASPQLESHAVSSPAFKDYWYSRGAELTRYRLEQARYGEIHKGDAVFIFVTENFLPDKQVKAEHPHSQAVPILKFNFTKKFYTGIYPYSIMSSTFTPIDINRYPHTLKVTASVQEWCGHTYAQLNLKGDGYKYLTHSYFEKEADDTFMLDTAFLEEEIWNRIRIAPETLPQGTIKMIPSPLAARFFHKKLKVESVTASLADKGDNLMGYTLDYKKSERKLTINFNKRFPYEIISWEETFLSGWGEKAKILTTKAVKTHSIMLDYWNKHTNKDAYLRKKLGID